MSVAVSFPLVIFPLRTSIHTLFFAKVNMSLLYIHFKKAGLFNISILIKSHSPVLSFWWHSALNMLHVIDIIFKPNCANAWWAHMLHFPSVCQRLDQNLKWTAVHIVELYTNLIAALSVWYTSHVRAWTWALHQHQVATMHNQKWTSFKNPSFPSRDLHVYAKEWTCHPATCYTIALGFKWPYFSFWKQIGDEVLS